jgi:hypothetical protein
VRCACIFVYQGYLMFHSSGCSFICWIRRSLGVVREVCLHRSFLRRATHLFGRTKKQLREKKDMHKKREKYSKIAQTHAVKQKTCKSSK